MDNLVELQKRIIEFRELRDWKQFHTVKDLLLGLNIEVSELQELFLWKSLPEIGTVKKEKIEDEIADIFIYLTYLCEEFDINLGEVVVNKIDLNNLKYPVEKSKGSNKKYDEF